MKNRRITIVAFLLLAALTLGIGYAALSDTLWITGSASVGADAGQDAFENDIYFSKAISDQTRVRAEIDPTDNNKATMTMVTYEDKTQMPLKKVGDQLVATFTVQSKSDLDAKIKATVTSNANPEYFEVYTNWGDVAQDLLAGKTADVTVTVVLIKTPNNGAVQTSFEIRLDVTVD